jgi:sugar lactone lactonase YvrE
MKTLLIAAVTAGAVWASTTTTWELNTYQDFVRGKFSGVSLTRDGRLMLAPQLETVLAPDQSAIWTVVQEPDGTIYAGTGHRGRVFKLDASGKSSVYWTAEQPEVFALAVDSKGALYAGTSPDGKIYRIENGTAREFYDPKAKYIWSLAFGRDGALYAGTGDDGKVHRVDATGKGEVYYETGQSHITSLAFDGQSGVLAGTEPNGILYRISAKDKAFVLYDANLPEIRAISVAADGSIYAAALGGSMLNRAAPLPGSPAAIPGAPPAAGPTTTITVTDDAQGGVEIKPPDAAKQAAPTQAASQVTAQFTPMMDFSGVEKSAVYRIHPDNTVETLWTSKEENVYDILINGDHLLLATDAQGRIYRLTPDRKTTLLVQTNENETLRLVNAGGSLLAATGNVGKIFRMGTAAGATGFYESPVHDAGTVAKWGRLHWKGIAAPAGGISFRTRSGNSVRPDKTWSDWSDGLTNANASFIKSPNARYLQWRAEFTGSGGASEVLDSVQVAYLPQNTPPVLRNISVTSQAAPATAQPKAPAPTSPAAYSITVTDTPDAAATPSTGTPTQALENSGNRQMNITWQADDADHDRLVYSVWFRGEDEREWKLLKGDTQETSLSFDGDVLADGKYFFRVAVSDRLANPPAAARDSDLISSPVLIDNTPPAVKAALLRREGTTVEIQAEASDAASALRRAEYSLDAGAWIPLESFDGVVDSLEERFSVRLEKVPPGEHIVVVRAFDSAGNAGLAKVIVR